MILGNLEKCQQGILVKVSLNPRKWQDTATNWIWDQALFRRDNKNEHRLGHSYRPFHCNLVRGYFRLQMKQLNIVFFCFSYTDKPIEMQPHHWDRSRMCSTRIHCNFKTIVHSCKTFLFFLWLCSPGKWSCNLLAHGNGKSLSVAQGNSFFFFRVQLHGNGETRPSGIVWELERFNRNFPGANCNLNAANCNDHLLFAPIGIVLRRKWG